MFINKNFGNWVKVLISSIFLPRSSSTEILDSFGRGLIIPMKAHTSRKKCTVHKYREFNPPKSRDFSGLPKNFAQTNTNYFQLECKKNCTFSRINAQHNEKISNYGVIAFHWKAHGAFWIIAIFPKLPLYFLN